MSYNTHMQAKRRADLVLQEVGQDGYCRLDGLSVLSRDASAHVGCSSYGHPLHAGLEEVQVGQDG